MAAIPTILKGDDSGAIQITMATGRSYIGATLIVAYQGVTRSYTGLNPGQTINLTFSHVETSGFELGTKPLLMRLIGQYGAEETVENADARIKVTDCLAEVNAGGSFIVRPGEAVSDPTKVPITDVGDMASRYTLADLQAKVNQIVRVLAQRSLLSLAVMLGALVSFGGVQQARLDSLYNDSLVVTNVTDISGEDTNAVHKTDAEWTGRVKTVNGMVGDVVIEAGTDTNAVASIVARYDETNLTARINSKQNALDGTQLAAVNSGITSQRVTNYDAYSTTKQNVITDLATIREGAGLGATAVQPSDFVFPLSYSQFVPGSFGVMSAVIGDRGLLTFSQMTEAPQRAFVIDSVTIPPELHSSPAFGINNYGSDGWAVWESPSGYIGWKLTRLQNGQIVEVRDLDAVEFSPSDFMVFNYAQTPVGTLRISWRIRDIPAKAMVAYDTTVTAQSTNLITSGAVASSMEGYLPLSGGTMTGQISLQNNRFIRQDGAFNLAYGAIGDVATGSLLPKKIAVAAESIVFDTQWSSVGTQSTLVPDGSAVVTVNSATNLILHTNTRFSNEVLAVGLGIGTNEVAQINAILNEMGEMPISEATTIGALLAALAAAVAWLKKKSVKKDSNGYYFED